MNGWMDGNWDEVGGLDMDGGLAYSVLEARRSHVCTLTVPAASLAS